MMSMNVVSSFKTIAKGNETSSGIVHFFNHPSFLALKEFGVHNFRLEDKNTSLAEINFTMHGKVAVSGYGATFGSFNLYSTVTQSDLIFFIAEIEKSLNAHGINAIEIKNWPSSYPCSELVDSSLYAAGFESSFADINQHINVSSESFNAKISYAERKKLAQSNRQNFTFEQQGINALAPVYELIVDSRGRKGYPVTMSLEELTSAVKNAPDNYLIFTVSQGSEIIAAAISIVINESTLYNFYHADHVAFRQFSPTVMLVEGIYNFCWENNFSMLDLGISSEKGVLNEGLFKFKQNIGAENSLKHTFSRRVFK